jgi:hypothetical protein
VHHRRVALVLVLTLVLAVLLGCASFRDTVFLVRNVNDTVKSRAVTDQGVALYELQVLGRQDYGALGDARRYFEVALRFDPGSVRARQYLDIVDTFRETQLRARTSQAAELLKRPNRSDQETYAMLVLVRQSVALSPSDPTAAGLRNDTEQVRSEVVKMLMEKARVSHEQVKPEDSADQREPKLLEVKAQYDRIYAIQPDYLDLHMRRATLKSELDRIFEDRVDAVGKRIDARQYAQAREDVDRLDALNRQLDNAHDNDIRELAYRLNYQWARTAYEQKQTSIAEARIDAALRARRTDEATAFKASIVGEKRPARPAPTATARQPASAAAGGEVALREVQDLVGRGELVAANRRINTLLRDADEPTMAGLKEQQTALRGRLPDLYARGVDAYRQEDFNRAVDLLASVVEIDVAYEQASDYLDKARAKQKLLEGLRGGKG